jgi:hypothetical protein
MCYARALAAKKGNCEMVVLLRDGRYIMVSYYYHSLFKNEFQNGSYVQAMREKFNFSDLGDIQGNLPKFIEVLLTDPISPKFTWVEFIDKWSNKPDICYVKYEDLRTDAPRELMRLHQDLRGYPLEHARAQTIASNYTMAKMRDNISKLNPGDTGKQKSEISFIRKGKVNGWEYNFSAEALELFEHLAGPSLIKAGYALGRSRNV